MSFMKRSTNKEDVKQSASNYINRSGVYPITILAPFVDTGSKGSSVVNFFLNHAGQEQPLYGNLRITNNNDANGDEVSNKIGWKVFNQLLVIADLDEVSEPVEAELPIGKEGAGKTVAILEDIADLEICIRVQMEYGKYKGNIQERKVIKGFYRDGDFATAEEIVNDANIGKGYEADQKYVDNITYKDDLTPEDIEKWVSGGRKDGSGGGTSKDAGKGGSAKPRRFAKK
jgi:hypothetical protein